MSRRRLRRFATFFLILIVCTNSTYAISNEGIEVGKYRLYCDIRDEMYIKYKNNIQFNYDYYYLNETNDHVPAYCYNLGIDGPESKDEYYVNVNEALSDAKAINILMNGFPYKSAKDLGVDDEVQAKYCTQFALWAYLSNLNLDEISSLEPKYDCVVTAIKNIYYNGINNETDLNNSMNLNVSQFRVYDKDKNYYIADIDLGVNDNILNYNIEITGIDNYKIIDSQTGSEIGLYEIPKFSLLVDRKYINEDKTIKINIDYIAIRTNIMFGVAEDSGKQNLVIIDSTKLKKNVSKELNIKYNKQELIIRKVDKDDENLKIPNVKFRLYDKDNKMLGEYVTNKDGVISIDFVKELGLKHGDKITIEEVSVPDNYYIDKNNNKVTIILEYDKVNEVVFKNERIFGKINITKKSFDYNPYTGKDKDSLLEGCEFEIYDEKMNFIEKITTNKDGVAESGKLYKGKYFVKEVKTDEFYILDTQIYEVNIKEYNSVENLVIYNKSKKKELPKTGF